MGKKNDGSFILGNKGGPGRPVIPELVKESRSLNGVAFEEIIQKYLYTTKDELKKIVKSTNTPAIELVLIKIIMEAIDGRFLFTNLLMDRLWGKVASNVTIKTNTHMTLVDIVEKYAGQKRIGSDSETK